MTIPLLWFIFGLVIGWWLSDMKILSPKEDPLDIRQSFLTVLRRIQNQPSEEIYDYLQNYIDEIEKLEEAED